MDVRDAAAVEAFCAAIAERFGRVDILVNNAGGGFYAKVLDVSPGGQNALVNENFTQVLHCIRGCVPLMTERRLDHQHHVRRGHPGGARASASTER